MAMEYLRVICPETRTVIIDDVDTGQNTGAVIQVEAGKHRISLSGPHHGEPAIREITLEGTSVLDPHEVRF